jgi:nitroreductase
MDLFEAIKKRRSVRKYTGDPIPMADLEKIVDTGRLAPSGHNRQPWTFIVVTNPALIQRLSKASQWSVNASAMIAVVMDPESEYWIEDGSAAIENMLLAATALGYGSCWLEGYTKPNEAEFKLLLNIPKHLRLLSLVTLGVPVAWPEREKRSLDDIIRWETF